MTLDRIRRRIVAAGTAAAALPTLARAQGEEWPKARPIRVVAPSVPGGGSDLSARMFAEMLTRPLGQRIIIDNKPGANGIIGNDAVAKSPPDGYTLLYTYAAAVAVNQALMPNMPYDALKDLQPVAQVATGGTFLIVTPDLPVSNLKEFVALIKANPGKYDYGSWGIGSGGHLQMEWLKMHSGLQMNHVPYKSTTPMVTDLQSGVIRIAFADTGTTLPLIKAGRLKAIAISGTKRAVGLPELPTMREQGFPFDVDAWYAFFAPANTPMPIVNRLNAEIGKVLADPANLPRFTSINLVPASPYLTPAQFGDSVRNDIELWSKVIKAANIKPTL